MAVAVFSLDVYYVSLRNSRVAVFFLTVSVDIYNEEKCAGNYYICLGMYSL